MDAERAYVLGLLHDIGRYVGVCCMRHIIAGYDLMMARGYHKAALICLTHTFPEPRLDTYTGKHDCTEEDTLGIAVLLEAARYDDEVRLIQLCDAISLPDRVAVMEQRLVDVGLRHGVTEKSVQKWRHYLALKAYFDRKCGRSIYSLFRDEILDALM